MHSRLSGLLITITALMVPSAAVLFMGGYACGAAALMFTLPMALFTLWDFLDAERRIRRDGSAQDAGFAVTPVPRRTNLRESASDPTVQP
jgi:hypothetical protein